MTTLVFRDKGWDVVTSSWTAATKDQDNITICYTWPIYQSGSARTTLQISMAEFLRRIGEGSIVDLR